MDLGFSNYTNSSFSSLPGECLEQTLVPAMVGLVSTVGIVGSQLLANLKEGSSKEVAFSSLQGSIRQLRDKLLEPIWGRCADDFEQFCRTSDPNRLFGASLDECVSLEMLENRVEQQMDNDRLLLQEMAAGISSKELQAFGNKHKNLVKNAWLIDVLKIPGVEGLMPVGLSTNQVEGFLKQIAPEIFSNWEALADAYSHYEGTTPFLQEAEAKRLLGEIQTGISKAFERVASGDAEALEALGLSDEIQEWLKKLESEGKRIIVRSTGSEDTKENANAGGNESYSYIEATVAEFARAAGAVVHSYFGAGSLQNRINAGLSPFEESLSMAVTAMEIVGEQVGGSDDPNAIPVSLVAFSQEPLWVGGEEFRAMRLSATYGHGEGVVGAQGINSDTIILMRSAKNPEELYILYDNQDKPERLAPVLNEETGQIELQKIANPDFLRRAPTLSQEMLRRLYHWSVVQEKFYADTATDMEIVVKGDRIYPVQARPINRPDLLPTYLDITKEALPVAVSVRGEVIVPGKGSAVVVEDPSELLICDRLEDVIATYDKTKNHLIVVKGGERPPKNSHAVVNFSGWGVPVLYIEDEANLEEFIGKGSIVACMQRGTLNLWEGSLDSVKDFIREGFAVHPAQVATTTYVTEPLVKLNRQQVTPQEVSDLLFKMRAAKTSAVALEELQHLEQSDWVTRFRERKTALEKEEADAAFADRDVSLVSSAANSLDTQLSRTFAEMRAVLEKDSGPMETLFHVEPMESLLIGEGSSSGVGIESIATMNQAIEAAEELIAYQAQLDHPAHFSDLLFDGANSPFAVSFESWKVFLLELESLAGTQDLTAEKIGRFKKMMAVLRKADVLPIFNGFLFDSLKQKNPIDTLNQILRQLPVKEESAVERLLGQQEKLTTIRGRLTAFGNVKGITQAREELQQLLNSFLPENFALLNKNQWETASPITRSIAAAAMNEMVDVYDLAVKNLVASATIEETEKVALFKQMLGPFFDLLEGWATKTVGETGFALHEDWPLKKYLSWLKTILGDLEEDTAQIRPSASFSVSAAMLGARTAFERHYPQTLADVWTLIHQNSNVCVASLVKENLTTQQIQQSALPELFKKILSRVAAIEGRGVGEPQLIGQEFSEDRVVFYYNVPLNNHAAKFAIHYNRKSDQVEFSGEFLGEARTRWPRGYVRLLIQNEAERFHLLKKPVLGDQELHYHLTISSEEGLEHVLEEYRTVALISMMGVDLYDDYLSLLNLIPDHIAIHLFNQLIDHENRFVRSSVLEMVSFFLNSNRGTGDQVKELFEVFFKSFDDENRIVLRSAFDWVGRFLGSGWGTDDQIEKLLTVVVKRFDDKDSSVRSLALKATQDFIKLGRGTPDQLEKLFIALSKRFDDENQFVRYSALQAIGYFLNSNKGTDAQIEKLLTVVVKSLDDKYWNVRLLASEVASEVALRFVKSGQRTVDQIEKLLTAVVKRFDDENTSVRESALETAERFLNLDRGIDDQVGEQFTAIEKCFDDKYWNVRRLALKVAFRFIELGRGTNAQIEKLLIAVVKHFDDENTSVRESALEVAERFLNLDRGTDDQIGELLIALLKRFKSSDIEDIIDEDNYFLVKSVGYFLNSGRGADAQIEKLLTTLIKRFDGVPSVRRVALKVAGYFLNSGRGTDAQIEKLLEVVVKCFDDEYEFQRFIALEVAVSFLELGQGTADQVEDLLKTVFNKFPDDKDFQYYTDLGERIKNLRNRKK